MSEPRQGPRSTGAATIHTTPSAPNALRAVLLPRARVAERAYALYLSRGGAHGHDREDWHAAERELLFAG